MVVLDFKKKKIIKQGLKAVLNGIVTAIMMIFFIILINIFTKGLPEPINPDQGIIARILNGISW